MQRFFVTAHHVPSFGKNVGIRTKFRWFAKRPQVVISHSGPNLAAVRNHYEKYCLPLPAFGKGVGGSFTPHVLSGDGFLPKSIHPVSRYDFLSISWRLGPHAGGGLRLCGEIFNLCSAAKSFKMRSNTFAGP